MVDQEGRPRRAPATAARQAPAAQTGTPRRQHANTATATHSLDAPLTTHRPAVADVHRCHAPVVGQVPKRAGSPNEEDTTPPQSPPPTPARAVSHRRATGLVARGGWHGNAWPPTSAATCRVHPPPRSAAACRPQLPLSFPTKKSTGAEQRTFRTQMKYWLVLHGAKTLACIFEGNVAVLQSQEDMKRDADMSARRQPPSPTLLP